MGTKAYEVVVANPEFGETTSLRLAGPMDVGELPTLKPALSGPATRLVDLPPDQEIAVVQRTWHRGAGQAVVSGNEVDGYFWSHWVDTRWPGMVVLAPLPSNTNQLAQNGGATVADQYLTDVHVGRSPTAGQTTLYAVSRPANLAAFSAVYRLSALGTWTQIISNMPTAWIEHLDRVQTKANQDILVFAGESRTGDPTLDQAHAIQDYWTGSPATRAIQVGYLVLPFRNLLLRLARSSGGSPDEPKVYATDMPDVGSGWVPADYDSGTPLNFGVSRMTNAMVWNGRVVFAGPTGFFTYDRNYDTQDLYSSLAARPSARTGRSMVVLAGDLFTTVGETGLYGYDGGWRSLTLQTRLEETPWWFGRIEALGTDDIWLYAVVRDPGATSPEHYWLLAIREDPQAPGGLAVHPVMDYWVTAGEVPFGIRGPFLSSAFAATGTTRLHLTVGWGTSGSPSNGKRSSSFAIPDHLGPPVNGTSLAAGLEVVTSSQGVGVVRTPDLDLGLPSVPKLFRRVRLQVTVPANTQIQVHYAIDGSPAVTWPPTTSGWTLLGTVSPTVTRGWVELALPAATASVGRRIALRFQLSSTVSTATPILHQYVLLGWPAFAVRRRFEVVVDGAAVRRTALGPATAALGVGGLRNRLQNMRAARVPLTLQWDDQGVEETAEVRMTRLRRRWLGRGAATGAPSRSQWEYQATFEEVA